MGFRGVSELLSRNQLGVRFGEVSSAWFQVMRAHAHSLLDKSESWTDLTMRGLRAIRPELRAVPPNLQFVLILQAANYNLTITVKIVPYNDFWRFSRK